MPYLILSGAMLVLALFIAFANLLRIDRTGARESGSFKALMAHRNLMLGVVCIFAYVGGEVSIGSCLINFPGEGRIAGLSAAYAAPCVG